jgi:hypothetical protein
MSNESNEKVARFRKNIQEALDRSERELELIAKFFHQHGYTDRAKQIYSAVLNIRQDRKQSTNGQENT